MSLPLYEIFIDESKESFVDAVALVDELAIESNFFAFSNEQKNLTFSVEDVKKELVGAAMIPDMHIFRKSESGEGYNVYFSKDTIRQIAQVFFKKGFQANINLSHSDVPANSFIFQSYIVDDSMGISSPKGLNLPDGSWVVGMKVTDDNTWNEIKAGKLKGFSVEGLFQMMESEIEQKHSKEKTEENELLEILQKLNSILFNK
jgi:plastocyanin domain-containing protein